MYLKGPPFNGNFGVATALAYNVQLFKPFYIFSATTTTTTTSTNNSILYYKY